MPGGLTLLASTDANIPTPAASKVTIYFSTTLGVPAYKDDVGVVHTLVGGIGPTGPVGIAGGDGVDGETIVGPPGNTGPQGVTGNTGSQGELGPAIAMLFDNQGEQGIPGPPGPAGTSGGSGNLIGQRIFTATGAGTYTPTVGTVSIVMWLVGAGGGSAGSASNAGGGGSVTFGRSGAAGAVLLKRLTAGFSGAGYVIGAKGTGGAAGNNNGTAGGDTTFTETVGPTTFTAAGGTLGSTIANFVPPNMSNGGNGAIATNGDINISSTRAGVSISINASLTMGGNGGNHIFGQGGTGGTASAANTSAAGTAGSGKGSGGGGSCCNGIAANVAGADGTDGMILIYEYGA